MPRKTKSSTIRLASLGDAMPIAEVSRELIEYGLSWRWRPARIQKAMRDSSSVVIKKDVDDVLAGFALATFGDTTMHISLLAVKTDYQRLGIATELLDWLIASSRIAGVGRIALEVRSKNQAALDCYRNVGFELAGVRRGYYDGLEDATALVLKLIDDQTEKRRPK